MALVFIDCEAYGPCPSRRRLTWFGAVAYPSKETFNGLIVEARANRNNPAIVEVPASPLSAAEYWDTATGVFYDFKVWSMMQKGRPIMVSDNPAYDWQWINDGFWQTLNENPYGHSARRLSDFYAGLCGDFNKTQTWKGWRVTPHDHNPVHDALGNVEAFITLLERLKARKLRMQELLALAVVRALQDAEATEALQLMFEGGR